MTKNSKDPPPGDPLLELFLATIVPGERKKNKKPSGTLGSHILDTFWTLTGLASAHSGSPKVDSPKLPTADSQTAHSGFPQTHARVGDVLSRVRRLVEMAPSVKKMSEVTNILFRLRRSTLFDL